MDEKDERRRGIERLPLSAEEREFLLDVLQQYEKEIPERGGDEATPSEDDRAT